MFEFLIKKLKAHPRKIVFTEGTDPRILEASARLLSGTFLTPVLVGNLDEIQAAAEEAGFNIRGAEIIDPEAFPDMEKMVSTLVELRKGKMSEEECRKLLKQANYFGTMLVKMGYADALLGGATYSTADTVRPALQIIKTKPGNKIVSSCFILVRPSATGDREVLAMGDCAINIKPTEDELVEIGLETATTAKVFGIDPKVAYLSYSTLGSGKGEDVDKMRNACSKLKALAPDLDVDGELQFDAAGSRRVARTKCPDSKVAVLSFSTKGSGKGGTVQLSHDATVEAQKLAPELAIDGELQFDAAVSPVVAATKCKGSPVAGQANTFIFPCIEAGNIGYKIAQRLGGYEAYGPILQGLNAPINDLSRGCNADEVYKMAIITAALA